MGARFREPWIEKGGSNEEPTSPSDSCGGIRPFIPDLLEIGRTDGGLHAIGWLPPGMDDRQASAAAEDMGVRAGALSAHYLGDCPRPGLVLGYAGFGPHQIDSAMRRLGDALRSVTRTG